MKTHKWMEKGFIYSTYCRPTDIEGWTNMQGAHNWDLVDCGKCLKMRCERCEGSAIDPELGSYFDGEDWQPEQEPCKECHGTGRKLTKL